MRLDGGTAVRLVKQGCACMVLLLSDLSCKDLLGRWYFCQICHAGMRLYDGSAVRLVMRECACMMILLLLH